MPSQFFGLNIAGSGLRASNAALNTTANNIIEIFIFDIPKTIPNAIPVNAECPNASEKNAILLFTIIVPKIANTGVTKIIAISAFFINA